jgi:hypothetical protein
MATISPALRLAWWPHPGRLRNRGSLISGISSRDAALGSSGFFVESSFMSRGVPGADDAMWWLLSMIGCREYAWMTGLPTRRDSQASSVAYTDRASVKDHSSLTVQCCAVGLFAGHAGGPIPRRCSSTNSRSPGVVNTSAISICGGSPSRRTPGARIEAARPTSSAILQRGGPGSTSSDGSADPVVAQGAVDPLRRGPPAAAAPRESVTNQ